MRIYNIRKYVWLSVMFCFAMNGVAQSKITGYQYWYDNDYAKAITVNVDTVSELHLLDAISTDSIASNGLHNLNIRFMDNSGVWSSTMSKYFFKGTAAASMRNPLSSYQYWYDNDYAKAITVNVDTVSELHLLDAISTDSIASNGLHNLNIRFMDNSGVWSSTMSKYFFKGTAAASMRNPLSSYQYWYDNDMKNAVTVDIDTTQEIHLTEAISTENISASGLHNFNIRFMDNSGVWSSVLNKLFFKTEAFDTPTGENMIVSYEYWLNEDYNARTKVTLAVPEKSVSIEDLPDFIAKEKEDYLFNIRFSDARGMWSSTLSDSIKIDYLDVSISTVIVSDILFYPNPATNYIEVQLPDIEKNESIMIFNANSQLIYSKKVNRGVHRINVSGFPSGPYLIKCGNHIGKLIIE